MEGPIITIKEGKLQGTKLESVLGVKYWAFKGIPFAQPPVGPLRFEAPQEPSKWTGIRDASKHVGDIAMQFDTVVGPTSMGLFGGEDCLYLNVYTNAIGHKRPVMFFIHGGGFVEGSGNDIFYKEDYFVTKDIVLVCTNYRLGALGFLNLGHEVAPGNQGLRDVIFALKWVQRNIAAFGGDPDNVTIFGSSSGSIIAHLFCTIPTTQGLFKKAILQSGTTLMDANLTNPGSDYKNGFKIASLLGMTSDDPVKVIEFLRTVPAKDLISLQGKILTKYDRLAFLRVEYGIVIDADYTSDPLIPLPIHKLSKNGSHVPIIIGHSSHEYLLFLSGNFNDETCDYFDKHIEEVVRNNLFISNENHFREIMKDVREFFLKSQAITKDTIWNLINMLTNLMIINCNRKVVDKRIENETAATYVFEFAYSGDQPTIYNFDNGKQPIQGVAHADELSYMFYLKYMRVRKNQDCYPRKGTKDFIVMERLLRMWYNFALTGDPTPELDDCYITTKWKAVTKDHVHYLKIDDKLSLLDDKDFKNRTIYEKIKNMMLY